MRPLSSVVVAGLLGACVTTAALAQSRAPAFETASVKPNPAGMGSPMAVRPQNDRLTLVNVPGRQLVQMAFRVDIEQIEGAPSWLVNEHFDVTAKATAPFSPTNQWQDMLRTLLEERFQLRARREPKEVAGFALTLARPDGRLGASLRQATATCAELRARPDQAPESDPCGLMTMANSLVRGTMSVHGFEIKDLAAYVRLDVRAPVSDETGLAGAFDWDLTWTPRSFLGLPFNRERFPTIDPDGPAIGTALEEQLGLKLQSRRVARDAIVIERVERPSPD
jgi:uncharacterized protein (TIGR03435 family)